MYFIPIRRCWFNSVARSLCTFLLLVCVTGAVRAQSGDIAVPTPISSNQISGKIAARDIGDARVTSHFYAFVGTRGDLLITVQSSNLNGDIDVFTADGLRPLLKFTVYAESLTSITKSFYLRKREDLIIRVEARTPNDDEGTYEIRLGGSFEPLSAPLMAQAETAPVDSPGTAARSDSNKVRRVSSVGARIAEPEPAPEIAARPLLEPAAPSETPAAAAGTPSETPAAVAMEKPAEPEPVKPASPSTLRSRRSPRRRGTKTPEPAKTASTGEVTEPREAPPKERSPAESATSPNAPSAAKGRSARAGRKRQRPTEQPPVEAEAPSGPRLIIQTLDGTLIERYMSSVRRVLVEQGQVVVVGKDGHVDRILLAQVVKMTIEQ
ncbi:MAG TPA: hypothetical protein VJ124_17445 [Pyrinomonadaceae bacterium]|nr:hypothetical protein [Pyrinomonadaceae bacterium]